MIASPLAPWPPPKGEELLGTTKEVLGFFVGFPKISLGSHILLLGFPKIVLGIYKETRVLGGL